ncbi:MAG TPA: MATE family efflux transporter [Firmicutes bacterium]|nr:MATE family efflux transporter [Bacillota bacterium]
MNLNDQKLQMIRDEKIPKVLIKLGVPTMVGMMVSALYSVVDAYFVGWLGTSQMGAVSIVFPIVQIIVGLGMTFGSGAASYISRLLGEENVDQANRTASTALFSSLVIGVVSILISLCFLDNILVALGATKTILPYAREYALIYIAGAILNIINVTMNNIITAEGRAKLTMISMLIGGGLNVILDPLFIFPLGFGVRGAAIATVVSQAATTCLYLWFILSKKGYLRFSSRLFTFSGTIYGEVFKVGVPILVFQILTSAAMGLSNTAASVYGDSAVAAVGVVTRIMTLGTYVVFGYMKGFQPVAGYNYGAKNYDRLNEATKVSLKWATIFCATVALLIIIIPKQIISLFSENDRALIDIGVRALRANGIIFPLYGFQMVYMALFLAMGRGKEGGLLSISRQGLFFIPAILIMPHLFGLEGVIWAQPSADLLSVVLTAVLALGLNKKIKAFKEQIPWAEEMREEI